MLELRLREGNMNEIKSGLARPSFWCGILTAEKYQPVVNGSGIVTNQMPQAGQPAKAGMKVILTCQPRSAAILGAN